MGEENNAERLHKNPPPRQTEDYRAQRKKAKQSYDKVSDLNRKARELHMSYGQYVAAEWAKEHVRVKRPMEGKDSD